MPVEAFLSLDLSHFNMLLSLTHQCSAETSQTRLMPAEENG